MTDPIAKPDDPAVVALQSWARTWDVHGLVNTFMARRAVDIMRASLIARLAIDAHNETGSVREYARSLLADFGYSLPPDPELTPRFPKGTPEYEAYKAELKAELGKWSRREPPYERDPFDAAPASEPRFTGGVTGKPGPVFEAQYESECAYGDRIYQCEFIRATGDGEYAHAECMREAGDAE